VRPPARPSPEAAELETASGARPRSVWRTLGFVAGVILSTGGLALALLAIAAVASVEPPKGVAEALGLALVLAVACLPLVAGVLLLATTRPGLLGELTDAAREAGSGLGRVAWTRLGARVALSPLGLALAVFVTSLVAGGLFGRDALGMVGFLLTTAYALVVPIATLLRPHWWLNTGLTLVGFLFLIGAVNEAARLGEGAMVFLLPFMLLPALVAITGLVRLVQWGRARHAGTQ